MNVIYRPRNTGKTFTLIQMSHEHGYTIVCMSRVECDRIAHTAKHLALDIPFPISFTDFIEGKFGIGKEIHGLLIDNVDIFLQRFGKHIPIKAITITDGQ